MGGASRFEGVVPAPLLEVATRLQGSKFTLENHSTTIVQESGTSTNTNWHHLVVTRNGPGPGNTKLDKHGANVTTEVDASASLSSNGSAVAIGRCNATYGLYVNGSLDDVAVYIAAFSPAQISAHHAVGRTPAGKEPTHLHGAILRLEPAPGAGMPSNPFSARADVNSLPIITYCLRNPFRITVRPGTNKLRVDDVGWNAWKETNRVPNATDAVAEDVGWQCYEATRPRAGLTARDWLTLPTAGRDASVD